MRGLTDEREGLEDYRHHATDVIAGSILGALIALVTYHLCASSLSFTRIFPPLPLLPQSTLSLTEPSRSLVPTTLSISVSLIHSLARPLARPGSPATRESRLPVPLLAEMSPPLLASHPPNGGPRPDGARVFDVRWWFGREPRRRRDGPSQWERERARASAAWGRASGLLARVWTGGEGIT